MNRFYHYAVVFFMIACTVIHGRNINLRKYHLEGWEDIILTYPSDSYHIEFVNDNNLYYWRKKRGFFSSFKMPEVMQYTKYIDNNDEKTVTEKTIITSDADVTTTVNSEITATEANVEAAYTSSMDATQSSEETCIVCIGSDVNKSLEGARQYLPLVKKLTTYIIPDLSLYDVVTLSLNVASLIKPGVVDYMNTKVTGAQTKPDVGATIGLYATGIYDKLKDAFKSHFGKVTNYFSDDKKINSLEETHSIFDQVKSKMNIFGSFMNNVDSSQPENEENQIETIVTQTYMEGSQSPITNTIVTKTYESGDELIHQATNSKTNNGILKTKLLENGNQKISKIITEMKNESNSNENSVNDSDVETYDDDNDDETMDDNDGTINDDDGTMDDDDGDMIDGDGDMIDDDNDDKNDNVRIEKEDFDKVIQEFMVSQSDFINTLDGEELLNRIDELQKSLPNPNPNNRKTFEAVIEELEINEHYSDDHVNKLIDILEKITNYFIVMAIENNEKTTPPTPSTPPTPPTTPMD